MSEKNATWENLFDFENGDDSKNSIKDDKMNALPHGFIRTVGTKGPRFLIVDDSSDVIRNHIENFALVQGANDQDHETFSASLWHADKSDQGNFDAFIDWLRQQDPFDAIFLDADLKMDNQTGFDLANLIHETEEFRYQPLCILTAQYSNQKDKARRNPHIKLLLKFKKMQSHDYALTQMFAALPELKDAMRRKFWADCHDEIVTALEAAGATSKTVAERLGNYLSRYHGISGWYLRKREGGRLCAIAMDDKYEGKECLLLGRLPGFLSSALENHSIAGEPRRARSVRENSIPLAKCGAFPVLEGKHALAVVMRADNDDLTGLFSIYRDNDKEEFTEDDERQLQQLIVHVQTLMVSEAKQVFQNELLQAIDAAREAETVEEMSERVLPFLHRTINPRRFDDEFCKSSFRVYDGGTGNLKRVGGLLGNCTEKEASAASIINVNNPDSTIARAVLGRRPIRHADVYKENAGTLKTAEQSLPASLVVPLSYDGAVLGALNFESSIPSKFDSFSEAIALQFSGLLASILFRRRSESFLHQFSILSADLVSGHHARMLDSGAVLQTCVSMLYDFCRFSNVLFVEIKDIDDLENVDDWSIQSWSSDGISDAREFLGKSDDPYDGEEIWKTALKEAGSDAFLHRCLRARDGETVYFTDNINAIPQADVTVGIRPRGQATLSQMVIKVFSPRGSIVALCLLFENPAPFTRGYRSVVETFAEFVSYLGSSRFLNRMQPYGRIEQYEKQLFAMYSLLMHSQKKISAGIVRELEDVAGGNIGFASRIARIKKKAALSQLNSEIGKAVLSSDEVREDFDASEVWNELIEAYQIFLDDINATLRPVEQSIMINCEKLKLKTILSILIGNSIEHGGRDFDVHLSGDLEGNLIYWDTGRGIPSSVGDKIFSHYSSSGGSGTGLIIARLLGRRTGISISRNVRHEGAGASFMIEIEKVEE
ncbi:MAG: ATP-binding protein [Pelagimonas sp.]|jgi:signal transduction histidine kinase/GAF domain-containing protein|nr:ATP-binding protein [Pelagimonas sp.]